MTRRGWLSRLLILLLVAGAGVGLIRYRVHRYDGRIIAPPERLETAGWAEPRVAIVFGASVYSTGELSPTLEERVDTAIALYQAKQVDRILVSGDNRHPSYNEPKAMQEYLVTHAVAPKDVVVDYAGRSTYDTCLRAREIFGLRQAVLVTQRFHLSRALYLANHLGIDAVGVPTNTEQPELNYQLVRELGAEVKAFFNLNFFPPKTLLGEKLPIR